MRSKLLVFCVLALPVFAQVPTIIEEIGELEGVRDPKCYATASRLEDFIYGTPLESEARFEKIALQKAFIRGVWAKASAGGPKEIGVDALRPVLQAAVPYTQMPDGSWIVRGTLDHRARQAAVRQRRLRAARDSRGAAGRARRTARSSRR